MSTAAGAVHRAPAAPAVIVATASAALAVGVLAGTMVDRLAPAAAVCILLALGHRRIFEWRSLLCLVLLVMLFVPMRRYALPVDFPFELEPYRVIVAVVAGGWLASLLVDPRVRLRSSGLEAPLALFSAAILGSWVMNLGRVSETAPELTKSVFVFASFSVVFWIIVTVVHRVEDVELLVKILVAGGAIVAALAIYETRTGYNPFDHIAQWVPFVEQIQVTEISASTDNRGGLVRAYGPAQHAISLGAALVMLIPLALALTRTAGRRWWLAIGLLAPGAVGAVSRTTVIMFLGAALVMLWLRWRETRVLLPLAVPLLLVVHLAVPGALGSLRDSFFPEQGLIAQQSAEVGAGRIATLGPALRTEFLPNPIVGEGFGTRVVKVGALAEKNAPILDDQWLGILVETGILGFVAWIWLFGRFIRRCRRAAKDDDSARGWLLSGLAASAAAYALGMFVYDAFSFLQVTFLLFIVLGLGSSLIAAPRVIATQSIRRYQTASQEM